MLTSPYRLRQDVLPAGLTIADYTDAQLNRVIGDATARIQAYCGWPIEASAQVERLTGTGENRILTRLRPIATLSAIEAVTMAGRVSLYDTGLLIDYDRGAIEADDLSYLSAAGYGALAPWGVTVDVTYVAGFPIAPLTAGTLVGATSLPLSTTLGFRAGGSYIVLDDTGGREALTVSAVGATTLTVSALTYAHAAGALVCATDYRLFAAVRVCELLAENYLLGKDSQARAGIRSAAEGSVRIDYGAALSFELGDGMMADLKMLKRPNTVIA